MKNNSTENSTEITARARAFFGQNIRAHKFLISDGVVRVWDPIAGFYSTCHSMSPVTQNRIRELAKVK